MRSCCGEFLAAVNRNERLGSYAGRPNNILRTSLVPGARIALTANAVIAKFVQLPAHGTFFDYWFIWVHFVSFRVFSMRVQFLQTLYVSG
jgi:hypothetical protein